jgi:hypothetical protein
MNAKIDLSNTMNKVKRSTFESEELIFKAPVETRIMGETGSDGETSEPAGFRSLNPAQKRYHVLFYLTAGLTGILIVQFIWQVAVLTAGW